MTGLPAAGGDALAPAGLPWVPVKPGAREGHQPGIIR